MPVLYIVGIVVSIPMIVHCLRTGRNRGWMFLMFAMPIIGAAAYFFVEMLPDLRNSHGGRRAMRGLRATLDPEGDLRRLENQMKQSGTAHAKQRYAEELLRLGRAAEAASIYQTSLTGLLADDPTLLLGFARARFEAGDAAGARETLDDLIGGNPEFKSPNGHMLYARALEAEGNAEKALAEYAALAQYFPGAEAGVRYARLLRKADQEPLARQTLEGLLESAKYAPSHYKKAQREWLDEAERELRSS
jgi:hypothetical protein